MAIYPIRNTQSQDQGNPINIEVWTEQATLAIQGASLSHASHSGSSVPLSIPLDEQIKPSRVHVDEGGLHKGDAESALVSTYLSRRHEPTRRDSLKRREALLKGKEGSRRRQRWENDRLLNNPWAQPPLPTDWEVRPTYPVHSVPYYLAPLWDVEMAERAAKDRYDRRHKHKSSKIQPSGDTGHVPKELREKLKRAKSAKGLLHDLEEQVRTFLEKYEAQQKKMENAGLGDVDSEDEDEIVFVGRNGRMRDRASSGASSTATVNEEEVGREKLVFDSLVEDHGASFGRWLVHSLAAYYGLRTWSITVGDPARREAYVGIRDIKKKKSRSADPVMSGGSLPRPLWGMV
ncbi:MAG: hypothetical protein M1834_003915 [Cirrosporium novae-zelandiae]|nr:MAG: hypothetical protein M1834_003915 [Cirrosporium novae-zelandiae]